MKTGQISGDVRISGIINDLRENFLPNEMRMGVHFGLGLTPYTEFHLDLDYPEILVFSETNGQRELVLSC